MNDYELIMVMPGIISLAIACSGPGVKIGSKKTADRLPWPSVRFTVNKVRRQPSSGDPSYMIRIMQRIIPSTL